MWLPYMMIYGVRDKSRSRTKTKLISREGLENSSPATKGPDVIYSAIHSGTGRLVATLSLPLFWIPKKSSVLNDIL